MLGIYWEADLIGDGELLAGIAELDAAFNSFKIPLKASAERAAQSIGENIVQNLDNFAPLAPSTLYATAAGRLGGPLYRHGDLMETASDTSGNRPGSAFAVGDNEATAGLDADTEMGKIGEILTRGSAKNHLPPRAFVRLLDSDVEFIEDAFADYIDAAAERAFSARRF